MKRAFYDDTYIAASEADFKVKKYFTSCCSIDKMPCFRKPGTISFTLMIFLLVSRRYFFFMGH